MALPTPLFLLVAAIVCSFVGRAFLIRAAFSVSRAWGIAVLCVPLGPLVFRLKHRAFGHEGRAWRAIALICGGAFFVVMATKPPDEQLLALLPTALLPERLAGKPVDPKDLKMPPTAPGAPGTVAAATPAPVVPSAVTPVPVSETESFGPEMPFALRLTVNQQEFVRLEAAYEVIRRERGYLRKGDVEGLAIYNAEVAKYSAELAAARAEQAALMKRVATQ